MFVVYYMEMLIINVLIAVWVWDVQKKRVYVYDDDDEEYGEGEEIEKNRFIFSLNSIYNSIPEVIYKRKHSDSSTMDEWCFFYL